MRISPLQKSLENEPIKIPGSPFWNVFRRFGRDEAIAMIVNVIGTVFVSWATRSPFLLSVAGPVIEKIGFFPGHFKEAWDVYKTTHPGRRKSLGFYLKKAFKGGAKSLLEDVLCHDPVYALLMYAGLVIYPETPVWLLAAASFLIAVILVVFGEVAFTEMSYANFKRRLKKKGFGIESYYEARFYVSAGINPKAALGRIAKEFGLSVEKKWDYEDIYFENRLPEYSGREAKLRLRKRTAEKGSVQTAQIVYTRAYELPSGKLEQNRYFPIRKEKIYFRLGQKMPSEIGSIKDAGAKAILGHYAETARPRKVLFSRIIAKDSGLLATVDNVHSKQPFYLLELKTYRNTKLLKEAMRFVMREFPLIHTTQGKKDIVFR